MSPLHSSVRWLAILFLTIASVSSPRVWSQASPANREVVDSAASSPSTSTGGYFALIIGNDNYKHLPKLKTASADANAIAQLLHERYGFTTTVVLDSTRNRILTALNEYRRNLPPDSKLLIYYAGHGHHDPETDKAYWLPVDAQPDNNENWISADDITSDVRAIPSQHVLIISDSCYSGVLTRGAEVAINPQERSVYLSKMAKSKSRNLMSSGGDEPVLDSGGAGHSIFADAILNSLRQIDDQQFTAAELFHRFIQAGVAGRSDQVPQYSLIRNSGHEYGDFVFFRKGGSNVASDSVPLGPSGVGAGSGSAGPGSTSSPSAGSAGKARSEAAKREQPRDLTLAKRQFDAGNFAAALSTFQQAAEAGDAEAMSYVGNYYLKGDILGQNDAEAAKWFRKSADAGSRRGMFWLGFAYRRGRGVNKDTQQAWTLYHKAADLGDSSAMAGIGNMYETGEGVQKDLGQALDWYRRSAARDDNLGMYLLGRMYQTGTGVNKSESSALNWYRKAAEAGFTPAMNDLGLMYVLGQSVDKNPAEAGSWFKKSADLGDSFGMGLMGMIYEQGQGVTKNLGTAESWYTKAAGRGDQWSADQLKRLDSAGTNAPNTASPAANTAGTAAKQTFSAVPQNAAPASVTTAQFAVMHYGGTEFTQNCMGWVTLEPGMIHYRAVQGTDGMHSYDFPAQVIKEVKKNTLIGLAMQAFHIRLASGEVYNFSLFDPNTKTFLNSDSLLLAIHQAIGK